MSFCGSVQKLLRSSQVFRSVLVCVFVCVWFESVKMAQMSWDIWITGGTMYLTWAAKGAHMKSVDLTHARLAQTHMHPLQMWNEACAGILVHVCTVCHSPSRASDNTLVSVFAQKGKSIPADIPIGCDLSACVFSGFFYTTNHYLKYFRDLL